MGLAELLERAGDRCGLGDGCGARRPDDRGAHHRGGGVESVENAKGTEKASLRGTWSCQWVVVMTVVMVQGDGRACSGRLGKKSENRSHSIVTQTTPGTAPNERCCETHLYRREEHDKNSSQNCTYLLGLMRDLDLAAAGNCALLFPTCSLSLNVEGACTAASLYRPLTATIHVEKLSGSQC